MSDPRDERIALLQAENARLDRAWRSKHERCVASEKEANLQFERAASLSVENAKLRGAINRAASSLAAAISLLEAGGRKAAPSDQMLGQMLADYKAALKTAMDASLPTTTSPQE